MSMVKKITQAIDYISCISYRQLGNIFWKMNNLSPMGESEGAA